jgi:hypothetical protein
VRGSAASDSISRGRPPGWGKTLNAAELHSESGWDGFEVVTRDVGVLCVVSRLLWSSLYSLAGPFLMLGRDERRKSNLWIRPPSDTPGTGF